MDYCRVAFIGFGVIQRALDFLPVFGYHFIGIPSASRRSCLYHFFRSRSQCWIFYIFRLRRIQFLHLFRIKIPGNAVFKDRNPIDRYGSLAVCVAGPDTNGSVGGIYKTKIRLFPADGCILAGGYIIWFKGMGTAERHLHSRVKYHAIQGA